MIDGIEFDVVQNTITLIKKCDAESMENRYKRLFKILYENKILIENAFYDNEGNYILRVCDDSADLDMMYDLYRCCRSEN